MECTPLTVTAPKPSFGMPVHGPTSAVALGYLAWAGTAFQWGTVNAAGLVAGIADVRGTGAFPGDDAWSPPPCS